MSILSYLYRLPTGILFPIEFTCEELLDKYHSKDVILKIPFIEFLGKDFASHLDAKCQALKFSPQEYTYYIPDSESHPNLIICGYTVSPADYSTIWEFIEIVDIPYTELEYLDDIFARKFQIQEV